MAAATTVPTVGPTWVTPAFLAGLATLITAITGLIIALRASGSLANAAVTAQATHSAVQATKAQVAQVAVQTNGQLETLQKRNVALEQELAGIAHRAAERLPAVASGPSGPTAPAHA
jgi:hypothetical protein